MNNVTIKYKVNSSNELDEPLDMIENAKAESFFKGLKEGQVVEVYYSILDTNNKTLTQLAKAHVLIKQLSSHTGSSFDEMKKEIKRRCGLYEVVEIGEKEDKIKFKSFKDCSKEELGKAIEECITVSNILGLYLS